MKKHLRFTFVLSIVAGGMLVALDPVEAVTLPVQGLALLASFGGWQLMKRWDRMKKI